jgi:hypothetical protein
VLTALGSSLGLAPAADAVGAGAAASIDAPADIAMPAAGRSGGCTTADEGAVTVVIDYQDLGGGVATYCATGLTSRSTGLAALQAVGVSITGTAANGDNVVCRLNGKPGPSQVVPIPGGDSYTEACAVMPPAAAYWSYWWAAPGGGWTYSSQGVASHHVNIGGFEGWSFAHNATSATVPKPRIDPVTPAAPAQPAPPPASTSAAPPPLPPAPPATQPAGGGGQAPQAGHSTVAGNAAQSGPAESPEPASSGAADVASETPTETADTASASPAATVVPVPIAVSPSGSGSPVPAAMTSAQPSDTAPGPNRGTIVGLVVLGALIVAGVGVTWWRRRAAKSTDGAAVTNSTLNASDTATVAESDDAARVCYADARDSPGSAVAPEPPGEAEPTP